MESSENISRYLRSKYGTTSGTERIKNLLQFIELAAEGRGLRFAKEWQELENRRAWQSFSTLWSKKIKSISNADLIDEQRRKDRDRMQKEAEAEKENLRAFHAEIIEIMLLLELVKAEDLKEINDEMLIKSFNASMDDDIKNLLPPVPFGNDSKDSKDNNE